MYTMSINDRKYVTREFLETLDKHGLIGKVDSKLLHDAFTQNFPISAESAGNTFGAMIKHYVDGVTDPKISHLDMTIFMGIFGTNLMNSYLEYIKKLLKILLDKNKISFGDNTTYGQLINDICAKLVWDKTKREVIRQNFFVDFRNAISHVDYYVTMDGVFFKIKKNTIRLSIDEFIVMVNSIKTIVDALSSFILEKTDELQKQAEEMEKKADELNRQAEEIKKNNLERKQKIKTVKKETIRLNRKATKLERKTEINSRKIARKNKTTARIITKAKN